MLNDFQNRAILKKLQKNNFPAAELISLTDSIPDFVYYYIKIEIDNKFAYVRALVDYSYEHDEYAILSDEIAHFLHLYEVYLCKPSELSFDVFESQIFRKIYLENKAHVKPDYYLNDFIRNCFDKYKTFTSFLTDLNDFEFDEYINYKL